MKFLILGVAFVAVVVGLAILWRGRGGVAATTSPGREVRAGAPRIPAAHFDSDEGLTFAVRHRSDDASVSLSIGAGDGTIRIALRFADGFRQEDAFPVGEGSISASSRSSGAIVTERFATWLATPLPEEPDVAADLEPMPFSAVWLGREAGADGIAWDVFKLFFEDGVEYAELFMRIDDEGRRVVFLEKDEDYREPLVAILAVALRDGPPPLRTADTDRNLASDEPLVNALNPLEGAPEGAFSAVWGDRGLILADARPGGSRLLVWNDLAGAPRLLATVPGAVQELALSPDESLLAVTTVHTSDGVAVSSDDEGTLLVVDRDGGVRSLAGRGHPRAVSSRAHPVWSPDGTLLAFTEDVPREPRGWHSRTLVLAVQGGEPLLETDAGRDLRPRTWDEKGLLLENTAWLPGADEDDLRPVRRGHLWRRGDAAPRAVDLPDGEPSPDGTLRVTSGEEGLVIEGAGRRVAFVPDWPADARALRDLDPAELRWLGNRGVVIESDESIVVDAVTGRSRILRADRRRATIVAAAPDGGTIVVEVDGALHVGRVAR